MRFKVLAAVAALSLAGTQAVAQSAAPLASASSIRAGAETDNPSELRGSMGYILAALVLGLIVFGVLELSGGNDDFPTSP